MSDTHGPGETPAPGEPAASGEIDPQDAANETEVRIRRAPKYPAFLIVGGAIGAIVTFILTAIFPVDPQVGFGALFGYFALYGVTGGVLVGALLALIVDRVTARRSRPATVVTTLSDPEEAAAEAAAVAAEEAEIAAEQAADAQRAADEDARRTAAEAGPHEDPTPPDVPRS